MTLHFLNDVSNVLNGNYVIIASLKNEPMGKLIKRMPDLGLDQCYWARLQEHILEAKPGKLAWYQNLKHSPSILYLWGS